VLQLTLLRIQTST